MVMQKTTNILLTSESSDLYIAVQIVPEQCCWPKFCGWRRTSGARQREGRGCCFECHGREGMSEQRQRQTKLRTPLTCWCPYDRTPRACSHSTIRVPIEVCGRQLSAVNFLVVLQLATRSRMKGVVKRWVINGYGFIQPEDDKSGNGNLFCHYSEITDGNMLAEGAAVEFEKQWSDQKRTFCAKRSPKANNPIPAVPRTSTWERTEKDQHMSGVLVTSTCILSAHAHHPCEANNTKMKRQEIHVLIERENTLVLTGCLLL